ncbi:MAG: chalcone isomerase family protein [Rhodocyclaceae bacterium]|nr:chalcone isomerase family protein [Rhodocyclaceae bacterium]MBX3670668.1 chalcone isomerase family protein [Rhodocyclaceae bacterium]
MTEQLGPTPSRPARALCRSALLAVLLSLAAGLATAAEIAGIKFADSAQLGGQTLQLNGVGMRKKAIFKVYAMGLYLPARTGSGDTAMDMPGPKRAHLVTTMGLSGEQLADSVVRSMSSRVSKEELEKLSARIDQFRSDILQVKDMRSGTAILLDYLPQRGTQLVVAGAAQGEPIAGEDFFHALLNVWLGKDPIQGDLKDGLLGKP